MSRNTPAKQLAYFTAGSLINLVLFCLSKYTAFPLWLDYTGSLYITAKAGATLGIPSVILHTLMLTFFIDGTTALWSLLPIGAVCLLIFLLDNANIMTKEHNKPYAIMSMVFAAFGGHLISFLCMPSLPTRYLSYKPAFDALWNSHGRFMAAVLLAAAIAFIEIMLSILLLILAEFVTPKSGDGLSFRSK